MPKPASGSGDYHVSISPVIAQLVRRLQTRAASQGRGDEFNRAFRLICTRMPREADTLGEEIKELRAANLQVRLVVERPVSVEFGVHKAERKVFIRTVKLLGMPD